MRNFTEFRRVAFAAGLAGVSLLACTETPGERTTAPQLGGPSFAPGTNASANLDQWANGSPPPTGESWQNGNLNGNNSAYAEGRAVPFRLALEGLAPGTTHTITLQYDFTAGGHKAYDYLASINATEQHALDQLCAGTGPGGRSSLCGSSTTTLNAAFTEADFPLDNFIVDGLKVADTQTDGTVPRKLRLYGGTITQSGITDVKHVGCTGPSTGATCDGNSTGEIALTFTATGSAVQFVWSGHLAKSSYWNSQNPPDGAGQVSGAPWHMRSLNLDGGGAANQDRSIQPSALVQVDANISIATSGVNEVGVHHAMTGHVNTNSGSSFVNAPDGTIISFAIASGPGSIVGTNVSTTPLNPAQCTTSGGTGSCTVYLYSTTAGLTTVNASTSVAVGGTTLARTTNGTAPNSGPLTKQWVDAQIDLSPPTATNVLGDPHVITALVQQDDGLAVGAQSGDAVAGFGPAAGKTVTFSLLNNTAGATFTTQAPFTCVTDATGQCTITITAAQAGAVDIHGTTTFSVGGVSLTRATGTGGLNSADAHKNYTSGGLAWTKVDGNGIALGGATFQYRLSPNGAWISVTDNQAPDADNTAGSFLISGLAIGTYDVKETAPPLNTYNIDPSTKTASITAQSPNATIAVAFVNPQPRAKIVLSPLTATNVLGETHNVTVTVSQNDGLPAGANGGDAVTGYTASANRVVTFSLIPGNPNPQASFVNPPGNTCTTNASGQCVITIQSTQTGSVSIHATTTFTVGAVSLTVATDGLGDNSVDAQKTWAAGSIAWTKVKGDGVTKLGGAVFEYQVAGSNNWIPVTDNSSPDADPDNGEFQVLNLSIGTYDVREKTAPAGYNKDSQTYQVSVTAAQPNASITTPFVNPQPKARIVLNPLEATNNLGEEHVVTATVSQDDGLAASLGGDNTNGYVASANRTVTFSLLSNTAGATFKNGTSTCTTDVNGQCSITLQSTQAGSVVIHATTTFSVGAVSLTAATSSGGDNSVDAQKTWVSGSISWTKVKGDGTTKVGGAVFEYRKQADATWIEVTDDVDGAPTPGVDQDGDPGEFTITGLSVGTYEVREKSPPSGGYNKDPDTETVTLAAGDLNKSITTAFVNPQPKAKIGLTPLTATNELNSPHTITATVSQDDGLAAGLGGDNTAGYVPSVGATVTFSLTNNTAGASFTTLAPFTCVTNGSGQCTISINTSTTGSVNIHASTSITIGAVTLTPSTGSGGDNSADATKVYVDAQIDLSPLTATNILGETHVVTATVQQDDGLAAGGDGTNGFGSAPNGTLVTFSLVAPNTAGATFVNAVNTCTTTAGSCSITIQSATTGSVTIHATTTFNVGTPAVSLTRATGTGGLNSVDAQKTWNPGSLAWVKNNGSGTRLGGATFRYRLTPNGAWTSVTDNQAPDADTDAGEFLINGLGVGTYDVQETQAPAGYTLDASTKQATITHNVPNAVISVAFVNTTTTRGQILPTQTTCSDFAFGNPAPYTQIFAGVKGNTINNVAPGVVFYYTEVIAPAATFQIGITQTNDKLPFPALLVQQGTQVSLYNADCSNRAGNIVVTGGLTGGTATISVTGATAGAKYFVGVKYDTGSPVGQPKTKLPVRYTFGTTLNGGVQASNTANLDLVLK